MWAHEVHRAAYRVVALGRKAYGYYRAHGFIAAIRRIARGLFTESSAALAWHRRTEDGLAPLVISSSGARLAEFAPVPAGSTISQDISTPIACLYALEIFFPATGPGPTGSVMLAGRDGSLLHRERLRPRRRAADGRYALRLGAELAVPLAGLRIDIEVGESGGAGARPLVNPVASIGALSVSHDRPVKVEQMRGALVLRILGRSALAAMRYDRPQVPQGFADTATTPGILFVAGQGMPELRDSDDSPMVVRRLGAGAVPERPLRAGHDALLLAEPVAAEPARELVRLAQSRYVPVISANGERARDSAAWEQLLSWSDAVLVPGRETLAEAETQVPRLRFDDPLFATTAVHRWLPHYRRRVLPRVSVVSLLRGGREQLESFLASCFRQTYAGELELVLVDDGGPAEAAAAIEPMFERMRGSGSFARHLALMIVRNDRGLGECAARNTGVARASGEIVMVIDADRLPCCEFVARHVQAHSYGDCDVVLCPPSMEAGEREPLRDLEELERHAHSIPGRARPRDALNLHSFLNCAVGSFSLRRGFIQEDLFDPQLDGWAEVEMGYRLYRRGARFKFIGDAFSVRIGRAETVPGGSQREFRCMLDKHPGLALEARRWVAETERRLVARAAPMLGARRRLRILTYRWHVPHQYELYKLPHEFTLLSDLDSPITNRWEFGQRPLPDNVRFLSRRGIRFADYDAAILHFDENVLSHENTHGVLGPDWGAAFRWFVRNVPLPKVAVCHGTPQFHGQYDADYRGSDLMQVIEPSRQRLVDYVDDMLVVCNSHQAQREWRFRNSRVVWHGFDPAEFPPATYERGILSPLGPLVTSRPHYRGYFLYRQVFDRFPGAFAPSALYVPEPSPLYEGNQYAIWKFRNYVDAIRRYSVYFNPTLRSPMPRARGEPMMCGVVTVSARNHDVDMFIRNGVNGFYADDPAELREQLLFLCRNPSAARSIGAEGRRTAADVFNHDRYLSDWHEILASLA